MLNPDLWAQGGTTMLVGMGIVFSFLVILVFAIMVLAKCVQFIDKICPVIEDAPKKVANKATSDDSEVALAIALVKAQV